MLLILKLTYDGFISSGVADKYDSDDRDITKKCMAHPDSCDKGSAAIYGMAQSIPDRSVVDKITW